LAAGTTWSTSTAASPRFDTVPLPAGANFWIFNTHTKHALIDGLYAERHQECMDAAKIMGVALLVDATPGHAPGGETEALADRLQAGAARDRRDRAGFEKAVAALSAGDLPAVGKLLLASHRSSRTWFENSSPELDFLVDNLEPEGRLRRAADGRRLRRRRHGAHDDAFGKEGVGSASRTPICQVRIEARDHPRPDRRRGVARHRSALSWSNQPSTQPLRKRK
jgi:hypothetical protein